MSRSDRGDRERCPRRGRMRGQSKKQMSLEESCRAGACPRRLFLVCAGNFAACGRRGTFPAMGKHPKDRRGTRTCWILQHFRRAKSEWLVSIPAGPLGPGRMENCVGCNSTAAPSLAEQVIAGPSSSGRSGTGPYERRDSFCIRRRGGCPHPPVPPPERDSWKNQAAKRSFAQSSFGYFSFKKSNASSRV